jgi:phage repressor protein C with HTH and peptisase S24 domain
MKTLSSQEVILRLKKALNISTDIELANYLGISKSTLSNWKARNTLDLPLLFSLCEQISIDWLLTGKGEMLKNSTPKSPEVIMKKVDSNSKEGIPLIPLDAVAGFPATDSSFAYMENCERYIIPEFQDKGADFIIRVSGDSMIPLYYSGDLIACHKIHDIRFFQWGTVYVLETSQGVLVKRVMETIEHDDCILCASENDTVHRPFLLPKDDIRSMSTIVGLIRIV